MYVCMCITIQSCVGKVPKLCWTVPTWRGPPRKCYSFIICTAAWSTCSRSFLWQLDRNFMVTVGSKLVIQSWVFILMMMMMIYL